MPRLLRTLAVLLSVLPLPAIAADADGVFVAAAANLANTIDALNKAFREAAPEVTVRASLGASGNLVSQIRSGAPYDVFLSADLDYPQALLAEGLADAKSLRTFATGRLVLWSLLPGLTSSTIEATVRDARVAHLAIANPDTAPYGRAAREVLQRLGLWAAAQSRIVTGENISQTAQFVESGNADAGFVAMSTVLAPALRNRGKWIEVPASLYAPIEQGAILTRHGAGNPAARRYLDFLSSPAARRILSDAGYGVPGTDPPPAN